MSYGSVIYEIKYEKTADKMFEELGYKKKEKCGVITFINGMLERIIFDLRYRGVIAETSAGASLPLRVQELKAINKKVTELGWM